MAHRKNRRLAAIMFTDIVGYTALMQQNEKTAAAVRPHHRKEFQQYHEKFNGEILQYFGDGTSNWKNIWLPKNHFFRLI